MNEVEKMYENAGIEPINFAKQGAIDFTNTIEIDGKRYPDFTAEKQIELIKWLGIRDEFNFYQNKVTKDWVFYDHEKDATHYNFELGLAIWVDYLWQDLTEEERKQIRDILE